MKEASRKLGDRVGVVTLEKTGEAGEEGMGKRDSRRMSLIGARVP